MPDEPTVPHIKSERPWYAIEASASDRPRVARVQIYDAIGGWRGVSASEFVKEINALDVDEIELHLNSPGGAAWDGIAIMNALRQHKASVTVVVDGMAASAASVIAMAGDEIVMARGSMLMIHDASAGVWGNAAYVRKTADMLDKLSNSYAKVYAARAGGAADGWRELMLAETWYDADEAVAAGLADRTDEAAEVDAEAMASFDLSMFTYHGRKEAPAPGHRPSGPTGTAENFRLTPAAGHAWTSTWMFGAVDGAPQSPVSSEPGIENRKEETRMDEFLTALRARLGLSAEATAEDILAAIGDTAEASQATNPPVGTVLIEQGVLESLQADAAAGRQALEAQTKERRDGIVATALREGRITKTSADAFRAQLDVNEEGTAAILATLTPNLSVPVTEVGHSANADGADGDLTAEESSLYSAIYQTVKES